MPKTREEILAAIKEQVNPTITEQDKTTYPDFNIRNKAVEYLGLPDDWRMTNADVKKYDTDAGMNMGMASMGSIGTVGKGLAPNIFSKLGRVESPSIQNVGAAEAIHGIEKVATSEAMEKAGQMAQKGTDRFKQLFQQFKTEAMKKGGA